MQPLPKPEVLKLIRHLVSLEQVDFVGEVIEREKRYYDGKDVQEFKETIEWMRLMLGVSGH